MALVSIYLTTTASGKHSENRALPILGIYPKIYAQTYYKDICSSMFISALFIIARTWKMTRSPSTKMEYYTVVKTKNKNNDIWKFGCKWIELEKNPE